LRENLNFKFLATGIGSVPFLNVEDTCKSILETLPDIPFWPQFVKLSPLEDMTIQASQGLPFIQMNNGENSIYIHYDEDSKDNELISFYEHFLSDDIDYFAVSPEYAAGLYKILELIAKTPENYGPYVKGQITGPITFAGTLKDINGRSALYNSEIMDTIVKGIAIKAFWVVNQISAIGKDAIIFVDEPYLSGFGSAFTPIQREEVVKSIKEVVDYVRSRSNALIGTHCCGNTDWSMIIETGVDIVNFDAFEYMDYFLLYKDEIVKFLQDDGIIAWGIVPTVSFDGKESVDDLKKKLENGFKILDEWGLDRRDITRQSMLTPACGLGTLDQDKAQKVLELLSGLSETMSGVD
jgi:methionine synthase II (cobalamin-independent)